MYGTAFTHNSGAFFSPRAMTGDSLIAGSAQDGEEVISRWISHDGFFSGKAIVVAKGVLGEGETLTLSHLKIEHALDEQGIGAAELHTATEAMVLVGGAGGSAEYGIYELDVDLGGSKGFLRLQFIPTLSAAGNDTAELTSLVVLGGSTDLPAR